MYGVIELAVSGWHLPHATSAPAFSQLRNPTMASTSSASRRSRILKVEPLENKDAKWAKFVKWVNRSISMTHH
jgi:hypothetical protein